MTAKIDLKQGSRLQLTKAGYKAWREARVTGITGDADELLFNALNDGALPNLGDTHPAIDSITLQTIEARPMGGGNYRIIMSYYSDLGSEVGSSSARYRGRVNTSSEVVHFDKNGAVMQSEYSVGGTLISEYLPAEIERSMLILEFEYTDIFFPQSEINNYMGKINSVPWLGYATNTVYCSKIDVDDDGQNFRVKFVFQINPDTWLFRPAVKFHFSLISAHPTRPDSDLDLATGTKEYAVYDTVDFNPLGFSLAGEVDFPAAEGAIRITGTAATLTVA